MPTSRSIPTAFGLLVALLAGSCAGPQPLERAIRPDDEAAYLGLLESGAETPGEAFLMRRAEREGIGIDQAIADDDRLADGGNPYNARRDPAAVSRGAVIYRYECMRCHGANADGRGPEMPLELPGMDFRRAGRRFSVTLHGGAPRSWFRQIRDGVVSETTGPGGMPIVMPAYADRLANDQIWLVVTYLQSLEADLPRETGDAG